MKSKIIKANGVRSHQISRKNSRYNSPAPRIIRRSRSPQQFQYQKKKIINHSPRPDSKMEYFKNRNGSNQIVINNNKKISNNGTVLNSSKIIKNTSIQKNIKLNKNKKVYENISNNNSSYFNKLSTGNSKYGGFSKKIIHQPKNNIGNLSSRIFNNSQIIGSSYIKPNPPMSSRVIYNGNKNSFYQKPQNKVSKMNMKIKLEKKKEKSYFQTRPNSIQKTKFYNHSQNKKKNSNNFKKAFELESKNYDPNNVQRLTDKQRQIYLISQNIKNQSQKEKNKRIIKGL